MSDFLSDFFIFFRALLNAINQCLGMIFQRTDIAIYGIPFIAIILGFLFISFLVGIATSFFGGGD